MQLQGRELKVNMRGADVKLLHEELAALGFEIPVSERERSVFGAGTRGIVAGFQRAQGLEPTGVVDERTAVVINREVDAGCPAESGHVVHGHVMQEDGNPVRGAPVRAIAKGVTAARDRSLGEARSGDDGAYRIAYE
jgi:peptidoglycan hydrolase-like protein with peptidoglycan-binding domain